MTQTGQLPFSISLIKKLTGSQRRWGRLAFLARLFIILFVFYTYTSDVQPYVTQYTSHSLAVLVVVWIICSCFKIMMSIPRLHDFGAHPAFAFIMLIPAINMIFMVFLGIKKGDTLANKYGEPMALCLWEKILGWIAVATASCLFFFLLAQDLNSIFNYY